MAGDVTAASRLLAAAGNLASLDRLAGLAVGLLDAPSAQISLLTDVQSVAGGAGLPPEVRHGTTPLSASLCTVTASCAAPLVVDDARGDARVADLPPVASGAVGAYLGVPLTTTDGATVGALCVFAPDPRAWAPRDVEVLEQLAGWAISELELAALAGEFETGHQRWELTIDAAGIGGFDWDLRTGAVGADRRMRELFGYGDELVAATPGTFGDRIHPDDVARATADLKEAVAAVGPFGGEYRVVLPDGRLRWVRARGRVLGDEHGRAVRLLGSVLDTTDEKDADARAVRVLESMSAAFISLDREWRLTYVNAEAERLLRMTRDDVVGERFWDVFPMARGTVFEETYRRAVETGLPQTLEAYYPAPLDAWYEARALPSADGLAIYFVDVTERRRAQELVELSYDVSERLTSALDVDDGIRDLASTLVPVLADWTIVSVARPDGSLRDLATWHRDPRMRETAARYAATRLELRSDESVAAEVLRTAQPLVIERGATDAALAVLRSPEAIDAIRRLAPESVVALPLWTGGRQRGVLTMLRSAKRSPMSEQELGAARTIAQRAGLALDNARLHTEQRLTAARLREANQRLRTVADHQRTVAQALQEAMLTRLPEPDHLQMAARYLTASVEEKVGGDWYDAVVLPDGSTMVSIGDVVGHDIYAAAVMGQLRNMLRMVAWDRDEAPSAIVARLDRAMGDLHIDTLATLLTLRIEQTPEDEAAGLRTLRWASAGHPAPVLIDADGTAVALEQSPDLLLGVAPERPRRDNTHVAPPDSTLLLYTDGLIETRDRDIDVGQRELLAAAERRHGLELGELVDAIIGDLVGTEPADDVAVLAVRFHAEDRADPPK